MPANIHTDDGRVLQVDFAVEEDLLDPAVDWGNFFRPVFDGGVLIAEYNDNIAFIPANRVSFITIPMDSLR